MREIEFQCSVRLGEGVTEIFIVSLALPEWLGDDITDDVRALLVRQIVETHPDVERASAVWIATTDEIEACLEDIHD